MSGALASRQVIGRYGIFAKIASGGMASVHFGRLLGAAGFSRTVAIKRLHPHLAEDPEFVSAMIDEARMAARIHHPNVVATLDVVADSVELLVVMEYVRGESLSRLLKTDSVLVRGVPLAISSAVVVGALHGLHAAHEATDDRGDPLGIVHRDVSPQNILVGVDGTARVIDFGVAKAAGRLQTTREGVFKGKMAYSAPEQLAAREVTRAADVYAMGVVLWETLSGKRLFQADSDAELVVKVLAGAKEPPSVHASNVSTELDALVMKALSLEPADRFASAQEMADSLRRVVPPAFPTDLGRWVEQAASEALADRGAALAEIESSSVVASVPSLSRSGKQASRVHRTEAGRGGARDAEEEVPTVTSRPSSKALSLAGASRLRGVRLASAVGAAVLLAAGAAALAWRGDGLSRVSPVSARPGPSALAPPQTPAPQAPAPQTPADAPAPRPSATAPETAASASASPSLSPASSPASSPVAATIVAPRPLHPSGAVTKPRPVPKPVGSIRFAQPD
jgi:serine/threonine-protein kinase